MRKSTLQMVIIILSSILFGFLLFIIPSYLNIIEIDFHSTAVSIIILALFILFFITVISMFVFTLIQVKKTNYISTLMPLRMFDSIKEDEVMIFYRNLQKLVRATRKSLVYITYPVDRYNNKKGHINIYSKDYYSTKAGKELKNFHKEIVKFIKSFTKTDKKMFFRLLIQNASKKPDKMENIEDTNLSAKIEDKFFNKIEEYKEKVKTYTNKKASVVDSYDVFSDTDSIILISDNTHMLVLTKLLDKYVSSFVSNRSIVKEFTGHI
ncbi:MAG: hypothetical protein ACOCV8_02415, partial [Spirochaetota bacterium]